MVKSRRVVDEIELHEQLKNTREKLCNIWEKMRECVITTQNA